MKYTIPHRVSVRVSPSSIAVWWGVFIGCVGLQSTHAIDLNYDAHVAPLLTKYCAGCHNDSDREAEFSVSTFDSLMTGAPEGAVVVPRNASESKLLQLITATDSSMMPPEGEPRPNADEVAVIRQWIETGAVGPSKQMGRSRTLRPPKLPAAASELHYVGAACLISENLLATGALGSVQVQNTVTSQVLWKNSELPGKVNSIRLSPNGEWLIISGGVAGLGGEVTVINAKTGQVVRRLLGHSDAVYCASMSGDAKWIASGSYDRKVILWDVNAGESVRELTGHNGPIYDLDFHPNSQSLVTASGDQTVKFWNVNDGSRLDTFGQPEGEMLCVRFSADGNSVFAGGADRQIRKWQIMAHDKPTINPMKVARFAHESDVLHIELIAKDRLVSCSRDLQVKLWSTEVLEPLGVLTETQDLPIALCLHEESSLEVVEISGRRHQIALDAFDQSNRSMLGEVVGSEAATKPKPEEIAAFSASLPSDHNTYQSTEPNDSFALAIPVLLPAEIDGLIAPANSAIKEDVDIYRFEARAGQPWIFEIKASRDKSKLDSRIDIVDERGQSVERTRLQAVRETYFTFRGKDSNTIDDFRLHKWEDMELDEYLFANGEVVRLWLYPRGPDSGFKVYPGSGSRTTFFDTTPVAHALGEPAYIVRELKPGEQALPNGLPVFPIYFENDDDPQRRFGTDSKLIFVAPQDGTYYVRVRDARGFAGPDYSYRLSIRTPQPDFALSLNVEKLEIPVGSGREWSVSVTRIDGLDGPISVELQGLPEGLVATNPLIIEAGQISAVGTIYATDAARPLVADATIVDSSTAEATNSETAPPESDASKPASTTNFIKLIATTQINGQLVSREHTSQLELNVVQPIGLRFELYDANETNRPLSELTLHPGETTTARIVLERNGTEGPISFGNEDSGRGLPHGAFVDNIGLNGLLIPAEQNEREFFITVASKVAPGRYQFHLRSTNGNPTSRPIWLNVLQRD